ncbi:MAG: hypothetical protein HY909_15555 [Deltaproteobacteria bacterium]|nr:hypothetical protein [Deltaproteobacteria bacterium]
MPWHRLRSGARPARWSHAVTDPKARSEDPQSEETPQPAQESEPALALALDLDTDALEEPGSHEEPREPGPPVPGEPAEAPEGNVPAEVLTLEVEPSEPPESAALEAPEPAGDVEGALGDEALVILGDEPARDPEEPVELSVDAPETAHEATEDAAIELSDEAAMVELSEEAEVVLESSEELVLEVEAPPREPDRGALLAATVTSRTRTQVKHELAADARAEAEARLALIEAEAANAPDQDAAEWLSLGADIAEGVFHDADRADRLVREALSRWPGCLPALQSARRLTLASGALADALDLSDLERDQELSPEERAPAAAFAAELAAAADPTRALPWWEALGTAEPVLSALAGLFVAAPGGDPGTLAEALRVLAEAAPGVVGAAANVTRARLSEGSTQTEVALSAVRSALERDPRDASAWLTMARIGLARAQAPVFRAALAGLRQAGEGGGFAQAAEAVGCALDVITGAAVATEGVDDHGVAGWLLAHALRDASQDPSRQVARSLRAGSGEDPSWQAWTGVGTGSAVARSLRLRTALQGDDPRLAEACGGLFQGPVGASVTSALLAAPGAVSALEVPEGAGPHPRVLAGLLAASQGQLRPAEQGAAPGPFEALEELEIVLRQDRSQAHKMATMAENCRDVLLRSHARFSWAWWSEGDAAVVDASREEASGTADRLRAATLRAFAAAVACGAGLPGAGADARAAAQALPGDPGAAELTALLALRGELPAEAGADALDAMGVAHRDLAGRMASVRASLRRATVNAPAAAEAVWEAWKASDRDAALGVLVLRATAGEPERAVAVLKAQAERAGNAGAAVGLLLAETLSGLGRDAEAVQAIARARGSALGDLALEARAEHMLLRAGMYAEVAERAFDQLREATEDDTRVAAYEKLAELDRRHRGDMASSVLSYQAILELAPGHMPSLRTLERYFLEQARHEELLGLYERLVRHAEDPEDAAAVALEASRLACVLAEGEPTAGREFLRAAEARGALNARLLRALDADARWSGDLPRFLAAQTALAGSARDPLEAATAWCRAAEAASALEDRPRALEAWQRATAASPGHLGAWLGLSWARGLGEDVQGASEALERAGEASLVGAHAVDLLLAAARGHAQVGARERALSAARSVLAREPRQEDALALATELLQAAGDAGGELGLLEARLEAATESEPEGYLPTLHARCAALAEGLSDAEKARLHWRNVVRFLPEDVAALRALARLSFEAEDWTSAADAMIRLARVSAEPSERAELFFALGDLYDQRMPDPRRAEAAWRRVLQIRPEDRKTLGRLADLFARTGEAPREAEALAHLHTLTTGAERLTLALRLARVLDEGGGDARRAEATLEAARREAPTDLALLKAYARLYERQGEPMALNILLDRAAAEVRRAVDEDPLDGASLELLAEILALRGRRDGARVVAQVALSLGVSTPGLASHGAVVGASAAALEPGALDLLAPPVVSGALRQLLGLGAETLERLFPFDPRPLRAEKLGSRPHPLRAEIDAWAKRLRLQNLEVLLSGPLPLACLPLNCTPPMVAVPAAATLTPAGRFAVARAMLLVALSLPLAVRLSPRELALGLSGLLRQFDPVYTMEGVDPLQLDEMARRVARALPSERRDALMPFALEVAALRGLDGDAIQMGAMELGDRLGLLATAELSGALEALAPSGMSPQKAVRDDAIVGRLVRVALSDRFLEARHLSGADRAT